MFGVLRLPRFGWRILTLLVAGFLLLIASSGLSLWAAANSETQAALLVHTYEVRAKASEVLAGSIDAETGQRGFLLTSQEQHTIVEANGRAHAMRAFAELREMVADNPDQIRRIDILQPILEERLLLTEQTVRDFRRGMSVEAISTLRQGRGPALMLQVRARLDEIIAAENTLLRERQVTADRLGAVSYWTTLVSTVLIVLVAFICLVLFVRYLNEIQASRREVDALNRGLEAKVRERTADLTAANEEVQRFAYIVSHDLRAPLVNVMGYTSELQAAGKAVEKQLAKLETDAPKQIVPEAALAVREDIPEAIGFIRSSTEKMDRLINAILKLSREGRRTIAPVETDLTQLAQSTADSVGLLAEQADTRLLVEPLPTVVSDRLMLEQVFGNLIDNAIKYREPGRANVVTVRGRDLPNGRVEIEVSDTGRGVAERDLERVFELFRRAGRQDQVGEGLGLAFVRNTVRRLGGSIQMESELGKGSTFRMNLPKRLLPEDGVAE